MQTYQGNSQIFKGAQVHAYVTWEWCAIQWYIVEKNKYQLIYSLVIHAN